MSDRETTEDTGSGDAVDRLVDELSPRELAGQLVVSLPQFLSESEQRRIFAEYGVGAAIVRTPNNPAYMAAFTNRLQEYAAASSAGLPLLVTGDFADGSASSMPLQTGDLPPTARDGSQGGTAFPTAMALGATGDPANARTAAAVTARELRAMGVHWNFAPVADVNTTPENPVIGVRSFGERPERVGAFVTAAVEGYRGGGADDRVLATAKHFPGHGDTTVDSHSGLPVVDADRETLDEVHLPPFERAIEAGVDSIMTAHVVTEALDDERPATLSPAVLTGLLREELGYDGLIVTDSMDMAGVKDGWGREEAAVRAIAAGADVLIAVSKGENAFEEQVRTVEAIAEAIWSGDLPAERVEAALRRVLDAKRRVGLLDRQGKPAGRRRDPLAATATVGAPAHRETAARIAREGVTVVHDDGVLPFDPDAAATTLVAGVTDAVTRVAEAVRDRANGDVVTWRAASRDPGESEVAAAGTLADDVDRVVVVTHSGRGRPRRSDGQLRLVERLAVSSVPVATVAQELPYDLAIRETDAGVAAYGSDTPTGLTHLEAAVEAVFGATPGGRLPVTVGEYPVGHRTDR
ncbi:glycoside hydrolase family 3 protein [Halomarina oriensis]|uniref:Glycoside hydrolase family 3 protein n=1 Tax=Halomarina oriensis TaxID=671145 RepID=A0A6B0GJI4_9EURY|nr:glycoside hydrolase family 3 N-terminal domain-containing protein [Halomarina oriensis]MWG35002.1 glycoside hydrolase family 3 protein [Halomarina oriensis]